jgi:hypothetical protein
MPHPSSILTVYSPAKFQHLMLGFIDQAIPASTGVEYSYTDSLASCPASPYPPSDKEQRKPPSWGRTSSVQPDDLWAISF